MQVNAFFPLHLEKNVVQYYYKINNKGVILWQKLKVNDGFTRRVLY